MARISNKLAVLCMTNIDQFQNGVQTFVRELERATNADLLYLSDNHEIDSRVFACPHSLGQVALREEYMATIISTCIYETNDIAMIKAFPRPRLLYIHAYDSLKHSNVRYILEDVDVIVHDRPMLAKHFIEENPGLGIPYRELTLPFSPKISPPEGVVAVDKTIMSHGRLVKDKMVHRMLETAEAMPAFQFVYLCPAEVLANPNAGYTKDMIAWAERLPNFVIQAGTPDNIGHFLRTSQFYMGLTQDPDGPNTYGVEYSAMEAMACGLIPIINQGMEFEYLRQGARASFVDPSKPMHHNILNTYNSLTYNCSRIVPHNREFLRKKNNRFRHQLDGIIQEFACV